MVQIILYLVTYIYQQLSPISMSSCEVDTLKIGVLTLTKQYFWMAFFMAQYKKILCYFTAGLLSFSLSRSLYKSCKVKSLDSLTIPFVYFVTLLNIFILSKIIFMSKHWWNLCKELFYKWKKQKKYLVLADSEIDLRSTFWRVYYYFL